MSIHSYSETFLLSNMSLQTPAFNRQKWRELESAVRKLNSKSNVLETYVVTGPIFDFGLAIDMIGKRDSNGVNIPVPSHFYKCILAEEKNGKLKMWAFEMENTALNADLKDYRVSTSYIEQRVGISLWDALTGPEIDKEKGKKRAMWR